MGDIVERLRDRPARSQDSPGDAVRLRFEAAYEIERLREDNERLTRERETLYDDLEALKPRL